MLRSAAASACCTVHTMCTPAEIPTPRASAGYYWSVHPYYIVHSRERNPWSFNATTRYWVNPSKFWKPIICRFVLWVLILFQWLLDAKISDGVSLLYNRYYWSVRPWSDATRYGPYVRDLTPPGFWALPARWDWSPHAHLPSLVMLIFFLPFSWDSSLIAHLHSISIFIFIFIFIAHCSFITIAIIHRAFQVRLHYSCLPSCLQLLPRALPPLFASCTCTTLPILLLHSHLLQLPQQVLHCAVVGSLINTSFIANINDHWQAFPTLLLPLLFVPATKLQSVRSYSRCLPG